MAQSYVMFSACFVLQTSEEHDWFRAVVNLTAAPKEKVDGLTEEEMERLRTVQCEHGLCEACIEGALAYLYSEEQGSTDYAECVMQLYLRRFHPEAAMTLEVAFTSSKPRPSEFGGAAAYITASNVEWMSTQEWIENKRSRGDVNVLGK